MATRRLGPWARAAVSVALVLATLLLADRAVGAFGLGPVVKPVTDLGLTSAPNEHGTRLQPGFKGSYTTAEFSIRIEINSIGLRGPEIAARPAPGISRVLAVGDSFTFGQGVNYPESWPARLEQRLDRAEVVNAGWSDGGPVGYLRYLDTSGLRLGPDLVLVAVFVGNDVVDDLSSTLVHESEADRIAFQAQYVDNLKFRVGAAGTVRQVIDTMFPNLYELGTLALVKLQYLFGSHRSHFDYILADQEPPEITRGWEISLDALRRIAASVRGQGANVGVVIIPFYDQVAGTAYGPGYTKDRPQRRLREFCVRERIPCLDLLGVMRGGGAPSQLYYLKDGHWTPRGAAVAATAIAEWIELEQLLPAKRTHGP